MAASAWDLGDGTILSNRPYTSHAWTAAGTYTPQYQICDKTNPTFCSVGTVSVPVVRITAVNDSGAAIKCAMWRTSVTSNVQRLHEGDAILAHGKISVYEIQGTYQLYVDAIQMAGVGDLYQQFELLKAKLQAEGTLAVASDNARARMVATKQPGQPNPFEVGRESVARYFSTVTYCAEAAKLRAGKVRP